MSKGKLLNGSVGPHLSFIATEHAAYWGNDAPLSILNSARHRYLSGHQSDVRRKFRITRLHNGKFLQFRYPSIIFRSSYVFSHKCVARAVFEKCRLIIKSLSSSKTLMCSSHTYTFHKVNTCNLSWNPHHFCSPFPFFSVADS